MSPFHSISQCPICEGGLCGVRICGLPDHQQFAGQQSAGQQLRNQFVSITDPPFGGEAAPASNHHVDRTAGPHGLVVCDECEAIWLEPDTTSEHQYPDPENAKCPVCGDHLWNGNNHWANRVEVAFLGYGSKIDSALDYVAQDLDGPASGHLNMGGDIV